MLTVDMLLSFSPKLKLGVSQVLWRISLIGTFPITHSPAYAVKHANKLDDKMNRRKWILLVTYAHEI